MLGGSTTEAGSCVPGHKSGDKQNDTSMLLCRVIRLMLTGCFDDDEEVSEVGLGKVQREGSDQPITSPGIQISKAEGQ